MPASSWPLIMPGMVTTPAAAIVARLGVRPAVMAARSEGWAASRGVAPRATSVSISSVRMSMSVKRRSTATAVAESPLPRIMPSMGMVCCALYQGSACSTSCVTASVTVALETNSDRNTLPNRPSTALLTRWVEMRVAMRAMPTNTSMTSHQLCQANTYCSTKPQARSCSTSRVAETARRLPRPSSSFHDMMPATRMNAQAMAISRTPMSGTEPTLLMAAPPFSHTRAGRRRFRRAWT